MLDIIASQLKKKGIDPRKQMMPKHIAFGVGGSLSWAERNDADEYETYMTCFQKVEHMVNFQTAFDIPIITMHLFTSDVSNSEKFITIVDELVNFFENILQNDLVTRNKVKISILGKWYDLPGRLIDPIKKVIDHTKDFDSFFLNLCINYDGREEIVDACKMIGRRITAGKIDVDAITKEMVKDELYSSYFLPPDIIAITGTEKKLKGILLWDSINSLPFFMNMSWNDFKEKDFISVLKYYQENKQ